MLVYEQATGKLFDGMALLGVGYAGNFLGKNNPAMQSVPDIGPLPCGFYTVGAPTWTTHCGQEAFPLTPDARNQMYMRSGFFLHGDSLAHPGNGSDGCIVQDRSVRDTVERLRVAGTNRLQVVAFLPPVTDQEIE
jgi:hypothetical protein